MALLYMVILSLLLSIPSNIHTGCPTTLYQPSDLTPESDHINNVICNSTLNVSGNIFNICPLNQGGVFSVNDILGGSLSFSVSTLPQTNCEGVGHNIWGVYHNDATTCHEIANKNPRFSLYSKDFDYELSILTSV